MINRNLQVFRESRNGGISTARCCWPSGGAVSGIGSAACAGAVWCCLRKFLWSCLLRIGIALCIIWNTARGVSFLRWYLEQLNSGEKQRQLNEEFDPGSGRTLAARLMHASRTRTHFRVFSLVADG